MEEENVMHVVSSSTTANNFKIGKVLALRKETEKAIAKFQNVCKGLENVLRENPTANVEMQYIPLSLQELSDIYKEREDLNKALAYLKIERKFAEYMVAQRAHHEDEQSGDGSSDIQVEEHNLEDLFTEMHSVFKMKDADPPRDPQEIVNMFMEAKKKEEEETAKRNYEMLNRMVKERKERLKNSRWERFLEYVNDHPIRIAIGAIVFLTIFMCAALFLINNDHDDHGIHKSDIHRRFENSGKPPNRHDHHSHENIEQDQMSQIQDMLKKLKQEQEELEKKYGKKGDTKAPGKPSDDL